MAAQEDNDEYFENPSDEAKECRRKISPETRKAILPEFGLAQVPAIDVKDQDAVPRSLEAINLSDWRTWRNTTAPIHHHSRDGHAALPEVLS